MTAGRVYMQVDIEDHELASKDNSETGYEFFQTRGIVTVDTSGSDAGDLGMVAMVPVGMSQVASVVLTASEGKGLAKGEEFGLFPIRRLGHDPALRSRRYRRRRLRQESAACRIDHWAVPNDRPRLRTHRGNLNGASGLMMVSCRRPRWWGCGATGRPPGRAVCSNASSARRR